jgi:pimeloyl-ACP methyl ester carboxylesterase
MSVFHSLFRFGMLFTTLMTFLFCTSHFSYADSPSFFFVHGALLTSKSWEQVQHHLMKEGIASTAFNVPGRQSDLTDPGQITLELAAKKACDAAQKLSRQLIWVGHSQGGAILNQALKICPDLITALVYVAAVVPLPGEGPFQELTPEEDKNFNQCASLDPDRKLYRIIPNGPLHEMFMHDLPKEEATYALSQFVSEPSEIGAGILSFPIESLTSKPKFYIETLQDRIIFPNTQRKYQRKTNMKKVFQLDTSHSPFLSQPKQLGSLLKLILSDTY